MILQAKRKNNRIGIDNNIPYIINDIVIDGDGFGFYLTRADGYQDYIVYGDVKELKKDFDIRSCLDEIEEERKFYDGSF